MIKGLVMSCHRRIDGYRIDVLRFAIMQAVPAPVSGMIDAFSYGVPLQFTVEDMPILKNNVYE